MRGWVFRPLRLYPSRTWGSAPDPAPQTPEGLIFGPDFSAQDPASVTFGPVAGRSRSPCLISGLGHHG
ncbi:hypothetical protein C4B68_03280 [Streptomyces dengpaensis]|uniref:Uncharacterized protein n=1 Tax=Streptomyces dengpaensis TaxID=2049881 RepID=A0ABM6SK83_9ACTN|nr:hypothetical protein C4B68_03280 [Streptomyces dengpaensis]